ncbi:hypothetical protein PFICI_07746 [Pestalotiopsis fici W106-1]|uniref:Uncharacterized protein n=1 Tax=Pestalotiopsis fici (strain W106-1 / CGMCC3.15140) TaxID=1229662 RepID=W3X4B5_PESFW|nr:uncharacterized protein PFICI_07746 [Pestalotiopsis fici W106-1]ETS80217.1 hypothetical protein PFICI_07746 [Pestalotiopsis fici W106-1]
MKSPITVEEELLEIHRELSDSSSSDFEERYEQLRQAAIFVRQNRKHFELWNGQEGNLMMVAWKKVESATRVPIAVDFLDSCRKGLADTGSTFRIEFVESEKRSLFSEGITTRKIKDKAHDMARTLSRETRQVLCLNNSLLPQARGNMKRPKTVHCEIQLLEHLLDTLGEPVLKEFYDFIGCSKAPCWLCDFLVRHATGFKMSESHAGVYTNWALPTKLVKKPAIKSALRAIYLKMSEIMKTAE